MRYKRVRVDAELHSTESNPPLNTRFLSYYYCCNVEAWLCHLPLYHKIRSCFNRMHIQTIYYAKTCFQGAYSKQHSRYLLGAMDSGIYCHILAFFESFTILTHINVDYICSRMKVIRKQTHTHTQIEPSLTTKS